MSALCDASFCTLAFCTFSKQLRTGGNGAISLRPATRVLPAADAVPSIADGQMVLRLGGELEAKARGRRTLIGQRWVTYPDLTACAR